jgi:hypothetical protein
MFEMGDIRLDRQLNIHVVSAFMHSSLLVFVNTSGWIGTLSVDNDVDEIEYHFWLPSELSLPQGDGEDQCRLQCTEDGVVTVRDIYGGRWQFSVDSIGRVLQSVH